MAIAGEVIMSFDWSDDQSKRLTSLYMGGKSFSEIAADMGCTRNAAIGKAHRMKLPARETVTVTVKQRVASRVISAIKKVFTVRPKAEEVKPPDQKHRCTIEKLTDRTCRFPLWGVNDLGKKFYCGSPGAEFSAGRPYCGHHTHLCNPGK